MELVDFEKYDSQGIHKIYDNWPKLAKKSWNTKSENFEFEGIDHIVFAGMGGSGAIGDVFSAIFSKTDIHVSVVKGYLLPKTVDQNSLIIVTSISGNTAETLSILEAASKINAKIITFSSGGKIKDYSTNHNIKYFFIEQQHSPRASFISFLYAMIKILLELLPLNENDIEESINELEHTYEKINSSNISKDNLALELARNIKKIPVIYYPWGLQATAIRFKNSLQENSKIHSFIEDVIEACHNGIVAWEKISEVQPILIQGEDDYVKTKERWKVIKEYFSDSNIQYKEIKSPTGNILTKLVNLIYVLDYTSIYHALINQTDPTPVKSIDFIKNRI